MAAVRGSFIAFEGGDGAGKSTQARLLAEHLRASGREVVLTFEPGDTQVGAEVRRLVLDIGSAGLDPRAEALLYAADRAEHVSRVVRPSLAAGAAVITDRYTDSSVAYQGVGRGIGAAEVAALSLFATQDLVPDLTVVVDVPPAVALARIAGDGDRLERERGEFHAQVRQAFLDLAAAAPHRYLVVDGSAPVERVAMAVRNGVQGLVTA